MQPINKNPSSLSLQETPELKSKPDILAPTPVIIRKRLACAGRRVTKNKKDLKTKKKILIHISIGIQIHLAVYNPYRTASCTCSTLWKQVGRAFDLINSENMRSCSLDNSDKSVHLLRFPRMVLEICSYSSCQLKVGRPDKRRF